MTDEQLKVMTIEEKAKRYDEAIEKAKYYYDEGKTLEYANDIVSNIFPELKESEDENIRKEIIDIIKSQKEQQCHIDSTIYDKMLTWLEKQGEQKISFFKFKADDWYVSKVDGKIHNIYHSVDKVEPKFKVGDWVMNKDGSAFSNGSITARVQRIEEHKVWLEHGTWVDESELKNYGD